MFYQFIPKDQSYSGEGIARGRTGLDERRGWPRYTVDWPVKVELAGESTQSGELSNIGAKGALIRIDRTLDVGTSLRVSIKLPPPLDTWISFTGQVVRVETYSTGMGMALRFDTSQPIFTNL